LSARTINFDGLQCKTTDGKVVHYFVYHRGGGFEIVGPNLERHRCHPFRQERQRRTNRNCQSLWRRSDTVTRQEIEQKMDELAREYHDTHNPEIPEESTPRDSED
jgi:hypothetical protein